jgi:hypothetical protein
MSKRRRLACFQTVLTVALIITTASCAQHSGILSAEYKRAATTSLDRDTQEQNRINSFFYLAVVPKLQSCWSGIQGKGGIVFKYTYKREGMKWVWQGQQVEKSSLAQEQNAVALQCMQEAARDTSFPAEAVEAAYRVNDMVLYWGWPVPFPSDVTELGRMARNVGGAGEAGYCVDCEIVSGDVFECKVQKGWGWFYCWASGRTCSTQDLCGTGWMGGGVGIFIAEGRIE